MEMELDQQLIADYVETETSPLQGLWARVHAQAAELDPVAARYDNEIRKLNPRHQNGFMAASQKVIWVTSVKNPSKGIRAGRTVPCPPLLAAQLLVGGTHAIATEAEVKAWEAEQERRKEIARQIEAAKTPVSPTHIHLGADAVQAIRDMPTGPSTSAGQGKGQTSAPGAKQ